MPHDLQHFLVERELGIERGIFGFLAAGGETGGDEREPGRAASRRRRKAKRRDQRMMRRGLAQGDASEHAAGTCWFEWLRRSGDPRAVAFAENMGSTLYEMAAEARRVYGDDALARVCACMDELSAKWSRLAIGESFLVEWTPHRDWPDPDSDGRSIVERVARLPQDRSAARCGVRHDRRSAAR